MQRFSLSPNVTMAATVQDDDDDFGTFLAYSPTTASLARSFGYVPPNLRLPSPSPSLSPLAATPPHLRNIASTDVGLTSNPPQPPPSPQSIGTAGVVLSSPTFSSSSASSSTPHRRPTVRRQLRRRRTPGITRGSTTSSARSRVARIRNTPTTCGRVQSLQRSADDAVRGRKIAAVTETRTVTTTYNGNKHPPTVTRVSTRQTSP